MGRTTSSTGARSFQASRLRRASCVYSRKALVYKDEHTGSLRAFSPPSRCARTNARFQTRKGGHMRTRPLLRLTFAFLVGSFLLPVGASAQSAFSGVVRDT